MNTGITAKPRVIRRRTHCGKRKFTKPSITICPDKVPVMVEFCPEANKATANNVLITAPPKATETCEVNNAWCKS